MDNRQRTMDNRQQTTDNRQRITLRSVLFSHADHADFRRDHYANIKRIRRGAHAYACALPSGWGAQA